MNFELEDKLRNLIDKQELDNAIQLAESELNKIPKTDFHKMIGKDILHLSNDLKIYIQKFDKSTSEILNKPKGLIKSVFGKPTDYRPAAYYCEMNGFTINYDRWFIDLFSFKEMGGDDWDWLCDFYDSTASDFTITGLEDIQKVFEDVHENDRFKEPNIEKAYEVCELLVILRLQELFRLTYSKIEEPLSNIPLFVTAHDYELIYRVN
ncbi:hypothetical protein [Carboxylicivirga caseinilyticus]|uniref:hypothetical protein n=1 Tax=Carboxylicivirga caseinilyticus TaxID=3417572 RepID=UPI003D3383AC|nr:hypothetical protein [Marinilabiliaceae bacterium A049]